MKLYYCPAYTGFVYTDSKKILFNEKIADTAAFVEELKLHAGLASEKKDDVERIVNYYKATKTYMQKNPCNVLKASFDVDSLSVAKECLSWRDSLTFAGWNKSVKSSSERLNVLCGIEEHFEDKSLGEELSFIIRAVQEGCLLPPDLEIETPFDWNLFSPLEVELLQALGKRGVKIFVRDISQKPDNALKKILSLLETESKENVSIKKDESFNILHFEEQDEALRYLSLQKSNAYDVWINSDNKEFDNWLCLEGKPVSGSKIKAGLPQITQLLSVGLGILKTPLDLKNLVEWLNVPLSPLKAGLRHRLEKQIAREGGYYNESCKQIIEDFVNCKTEFLELKEEERKEKIKEESKKRKSAVERFLPDIDSAENFTDESVSKNKVVTFSKALCAWCSSQIIFLSDQMQRTQLYVVRSECSALLNMLQTETEDRISFKNLMSFVSNLKDGIDLVQYEAQSGCRTVIGGAGQMAFEADKIIWCDFYNESQENLKYDFLLPVEKLELKQKLKLWDENTEREFNHKIKLLPFYLANKITLVVIDKKLTEDAEKHSVYIQLEKKIKNFCDFVENPDVNEEYKNLFVDAELINNGMPESDEGLNIKNARLIQWPERETYSSFEQLVFNPFDYAFQYLAEIYSLGNSSLPKINQTYGTVAHAVIETLFNTYDDVKGSGTVAKIKENIKNDFDKVFADMVNAHGAILLLKENILNLENYKTQVYDCVNELVKVLEENKLHVLKCEPWLENADMGFFGNIKIGGFADMILADEKENPVVFDFKWYPGKQDKFKSIVEENKSVQLELYKYLTKEIAQKEACKVAYVILPEVIVISAQDFASENAIKVSLKNTEPLLPKLKNSYKYRREQIQNGFIEEAAGFAPEMISYQKDAEGQNLIPLNFDGKREPKKQAKPYPQYDFFKSKK